MERVRSAPATHDVSRNAARFLETFACIDVTHIAPAISYPTLILQARDELRVPFAAARELASSSPTADSCRSPVATTSSPRMRRARRGGSLISAT